MHHNKPVKPPEPDDTGEIECECGTIYDVSVDEECPVCQELMAIQAF